MGLKAKDFNLEELKGADILEMKIDRNNESTVTFQTKKGNMVRRRLPVAVLNLVEFWHEN